MLHFTFGTITQALVFSDHGVYINEPTQTYLNLVLKGIYLFAFEDTLLKFLFLIAPKL